MSEDEAPRRRRHRRVVAPATNAQPEDAPDFSEPHGELEAMTPTAEGTAQEVGLDQWWRDQRPPHWE
ncbi:hypothetical protein [Ornithinimicrobium murale]|uniref:hypothetical protein n=1 Tax=Ornithinimicrobium murale TaxID=1050153 RepID=UPI000E0CC0F2|nr:hypothetical protein [Ornithinimicrobium murale]